MIEMVTREIDTDYYEWFEKQNNPNEINNTPIPAVQVQRRKVRIKPKHKTPPKITIGDEVIDKDTIHAVILDIDNDLLFVYTENGCVEEWKTSNVRPTGRKYDIQGILNSLQRE